MTMNQEPLPIEFTMPPEVAKAIVKVMTGVRRLGDDAKNQHDGYAFVSIDKFLELCRPLMADAGIFFLMNEDGYEVREGLTKSGNKTSVLWSRWLFYVVHESGVMAGPYPRNVIVQGGMAQAFGSAQSYLWKQFARSLFAIATGDKDDPDLGGEGDIDPGQHNGAPPRPKRQEAPETPSEIADFAAVKLSINNAISPAEAKAALNHRYVGHLREAGKLAGNIIRQARLAELEQLVQAKAFPKYFTVLDAEGKDVGSLVAGKAAAMIAGMIRKTPALTIAIYEHNQDTLADIAKAGISIEDIIEAYNTANASVLSGAKQGAVDHDTSEVIPAAPVETAEQTEARKAAELTALGQAICARMFKAKSVDALSTILDELEVQSLQKTAPEAFEKIVAYYDKRVGIIDATPLSA